MFNAVRTTGQISEFQTVGRSDRRSSNRKSSTAVGAYVLRVESITISWYRFAERRQPRGDFRGGGGMVGEVHHDAKLVCDFLWSSSSRSVVRPRPNFCPRGRQHWALAAAAAYPRSSLSLPHRLHYNHTMVDAWHHKSIHECCFWSRISDKARVRFCDVTHRFIIKWSSVTTKLAKPIEVSCAGRLFETIRHASQGSSHADKKVTPSTRTWSLASGGHSVWAELQGRIATSQERDAVFETAQSNSVLAGLICKRFAAIQ